MRRFVLCVLLLALQTGQAGSPDATRVPPATKITDGAGAVWTLQGTAVMKNGIFSNGSGTILTWCGGEVRTLGSDNHWWRWNGSSWLQEGTADPCPAPPPVTHPCDLVAIPVTAVAAGVPFRVGFCMPLDDQTGAPATITSCRISIDGNQASDGPISPIGTPSPISAKNYYEVGLTLGELGPHTLTAQCRRREPPATVESPLSAATAPLTLTVVANTLPRVPLAPGKPVIIKAQ